MSNQKTFSSHQHRFVTYAYSAAEGLTYIIVSNATYTIKILNFSFKNYYTGHCIHFPVVVFCWAVHSKPTSLLVRISGHGSSYNEALSCRIRHLSQDITKCRLPFDRDGLYRSYAASRICYSIYRPPSDERNI